MESTITYSKGVFTVNDPDRATKSFYSELQLLDFLKEERPESSEGYHLETIRQVIKLGEVTF